MFYAVVVPAFEKHLENTKKLYPSLCDTIEKTLEFADRPSDLIQFIADEMCSKYGFEEIKFTVSFGFWGTLTKDDRLENEDDKFDNEVAKLIYQAGYKMIRN